MHRALALALLIPLNASALTIDVSFRGLVAGVQATLGGPLPLPLDFFLDAPATGRFTADIPDDWLAGQPLDRFLPLTEGSAALDFSVRGQSFAYRLGEGVDPPGLLLPEASGQRLSFWSNFRFRGGGFLLDFRSDDGSLLDGTSPATYDLTDDTVDHMGISFVDPSRRIEGFIRVTSFSFARVAAPVPEPAPWLMLGLGVAALAVGRRLSAGRNSAPPPAAC